MVLLIIAQEYPPYLVGGVGTHVQQLARGLVRSGHAVHVVTYSMNGTYTANDEGVNLYYLQFPFKGRSNQYEGEVDEFEYLNRELYSYVSSAIESGLVRPELIHLHEWLGAGCAELLRQRYGLPTVITAHTVQGWLVENLLPHKNASEICRLEAESFRAADRIVAVSHSIKDEIVDRYGVVKSQIHVVPNGFDATSFVSCSSSAAAERERPVLGCGTDRLIVYAGRLSPQKGISALLRSALQLLPQRDDVTYLIIGELEANSYADFLKIMVRNHVQLKRKVIFTGYVTRDRLANFYRLGTLAVVPSLFEPFGYAALEPMSLGKPVVATRTGGLSEIIEDNLSGLLVPLVKAEGSTALDVDICALCEAQLRILDDLSLAVRLGTCGQQRAIRAFGFERMITQTLEVYRTIPAIYHPAEARA